jgi:hypothetical protein
MITFQKETGAYVLMPVLPWLNGSSKAETQSKGKENALIAQLKGQAVTPTLALSIFALGSASTLGVTFIYR